MTTLSIPTVAAIMFPKRKPAEAEVLFIRAVQITKGAGAPPAFDEADCMTEAALRAWKKRAIDAGVSPRVFGALA